VSRCRRPAAGLPVKVSVHTTAPALVTEGALHDAVNPFGNPDWTPIDDPAALLATVNPLNGVAVTVTVDVRATASIPTRAPQQARRPCLLHLKSDCLGHRQAVALGRYGHCHRAHGRRRRNCKGDGAGSASEESVTGLPLHDAVTPAGKPLTLRVTAPLNVPFRQASPGPQRTCPAQQQANWRPWSPSALEGQRHGHGQGRARFVRASICGRYARAQIQRR